jgi:hypothetical protein
MLVVMARRSPSREYVVLVRVRPRVLTGGHVYRLLSCAQRGIPNSGPPVPRVERATDPFELAKEFFIGVCRSPR